MAPGSSLLINLSVLIEKPTGISIYARKVIPQLQALAPTLLTAQPWPGFHHIEIPAHLNPEYGLKGHIRRLLWTQLQLPRLYRQHQANLVFSPVPEAPLWPNCRSVVMAHDLIPLRFPRRFSGLTAYFRYGLPLTLHRAEHIVCNSIATAQELMERFDLSDRKITPIPLAYDPNQYRPLNLPRQRYFLYLGRPDPHKNLQRLISAFGQLSPDLETELWIAGTPDRRYTPKLQALAQTLPQADRIKFLDYVPYDQLPQLYGSALALVFPSLWEGFGLPVLEAMACGTPVITSNLSALPEVTGDAALLVNPYEVGEIAEAMGAIATDSSLWQRLHQAGLQRVKEFSWIKTGKATAQVLESLL
jgi:glycosyltransferase involved in cell wall biosynthesis